MYKSILKDNSKILVWSANSSQKNILKCIKKFLDSNLCSVEWCPSFKSISLPLEMSLFMETQLGTGEDDL